MKAILLTGLMLCLCGPLSWAQSARCDASETTCVLEAAWSAALILPSEKQGNLAPAFLELAQLSEEAEVINFWENRFGQSVESLPVYPDYGWQIAEPLIETVGVEGLIEAATRRVPPLNFGRADALLSSGRHFLHSDPDSARTLNEALFELTNTASKFERPSLAHAAAELAMMRCDRDGFERAIAQTDAPRNLRYAFWRGRISGQILDLLDQVRNIENDRDTREVRRVLDGYRAILEHGYCTSSKS